MAAGRYRYVMSQEIDAMDLEPLVSGLEDEGGFSLAELTGKDALAQMLSDGDLTFDLTVRERFHGFADCISILSVYLSEYVSAVEVVEDLDAALRRSSVRCWRYV